MFIIKVHDVVEVELVQLVPFGHLLADFFVTILVLDLSAVVVARDVVDDGPPEHPFFEDSVSLFLEFPLFSFLLFFYTFFNSESCLS